MQKKNSNKLFSPPNRTLYIVGEIGYDLIEQLLRELDSMDMDAEEPIYIHICSDGGLVGPAVGVFDILRFCKSPIVTIASGECGSAALLLFLAGDKRIASKHASFFFHPPFIEHPPLINSAQRLQALTEDYKHSYDTFESLFKARAGITDAVWDFKFKDNTYLHLSSKEALELNLATDVLEYKSKAMKGDSNGLKRKRSKSQGS